MFHRSEIELFLGAAFTTVGLIALAFLLIRRRFDALVFWLALFSILYGSRLWLTFSLARTLAPPSDFFARLLAAINFLVPIPAFFFFLATGFMGRLGKYVIYTASAILICLILIAALGAPLGTLYNVNNGVIVCTLLVLVVQSFRQARPDRDFIMIRNGVLVFVAFALWRNFNGWFGAQAEPYGFAVFLGCLGYVAARRTIERDQQLNAIQQELDVARRIQQSILPAAFPPSAHFRIAARYVPMTSVAGDFYDFLAAGDGSAGLLIADVSGHGVPAALIASMVKIAANSQRAHIAHPEKMLAGMNDALCGNTQSQFVTAAYVYLNAEQGELRYAAAGHPPMLLVRDGEIAAIEENGMMLALFSSASYTATLRELWKGDRLVLYTDGIVEAEDAKQEQFGRERLCALLKESARLGPDETAELILTRVRDWAAAQDDDLTLLICDFAG